MIVYHAITTFHLIEAWVHKLLFHNNDEVLFMYDDIMDEKFNNIKILEQNKIFSSVYPIPYRKSPQQKEKLDEWENIIFNDLKIETAEKIYVAGGQFFFSDWLIKREIPFIFCEEASGRLSKPEVVMENDKTINMLRYEIAVMNGMYTGDHELVIHKIYNQKAQTNGFFDDKAIHFDVVENISQLSEADRRFIMTYFDAPTDLRVDKKSVVMLTQHFTNLKMMSLKQQIALYQQTFDYYLGDYQPIIKVHPDDQVFYRKIIRGSIVIDKKFPSELLPYAFAEMPQKIATISSTGIYSFLNIFKDSLNFNPMYEKAYIKNHQLYLICFAIKLIANHDVISIKYNGQNWTQLCNMMDTFMLKGVADECGKIAINDVPDEKEIDEAEINILIDPHQHIYLYDWIKKNQTNIVVKIINIYHEGTLSGKEQVLFFSKNHEILERIMKMSYIKKLENSELEIVVLENSELENKVHVLEAILKTTENRLAELLKNQCND